MTRPLREPQPAAPAFLCRLADLADGAIRGVDPFGEELDRVILLRRGAAIWAFRNICPHYGRTPLGWKRGAFLNARGDRIVCFAHGAEFALEDGACTVGACLGQALEGVPIEIRDAGLWWLAP